MPTAASAPPSVPMRPPSPRAVSGGARTFANRRVEAVPSVRIDGPERAGAPGDGPRQPCFEPTRRTQREPMQRSTSAIEILPAAGQRLHNRGLTGRGVGIAVIDSGVTAPDEFGDRLVVGPDLTVDGGTDDHGRDRNGHGTTLAGLAAGTRTGLA